METKRINQEKINFLDAEMKLVLDHMNFVQHLQKEHYINLLKKSNEQFTKETVRIVLSLEELKVSDWQSHCPATMSAGYKEFLKKMAKANSEQQRLQKELDSHRGQIRRTIHTEMQNGSQGSSIGVLFQRSSVSSLAGGEIPLKTELFGLRNSRSSTRCSKMTRTLLGRSSKSRGNQI